MIVELTNEKGMGSQENVRGLDASRIDEYGVDIEIQQSPDRLMGKHGETVERNTVNQPETENLSLLVKSYGCLKILFDWTVLIL